MKRIISCKFNMDTACVELKFTDGSMISIDTDAVEAEVTHNIHQRSELDYLVYNDPAAYADLILNGDPEAYLKAVTEYKPLDGFVNECCQKKTDINSIRQPEIPNVFWKYYDLYRRKKISLKEYAAKTEIDEPTLKIFLNLIAQE